MKPKMECSVRKEEKVGSCPSKSLPLSGQTFFLCLRRKCLNETKLQQRIENLGGRFEKFFNNDVTCVLTDEEVNSKSGSAETLKKEDVIAADSKTLKASPSKDCVNNWKDDQLRRLSMNEKAIAWGKKLWRIDKFLTWIRNQEQGRKVPTNAIKRYASKHTKTLRTKLPGRKNSKEDITRLEGPFIKVETVPNHFKPYYKVLINEPSICIRKSYPRSPFDDEREQLSYIKHAKSVENRKTTSAVNSLPGKRKLVAKVTRPQRQYCECCNIYFQNLDQHLKGPKHSQFVQNASNFDCITSILEEFEGSLTLEDDPDLIRSGSESVFDLPLPLISGRCKNENDNLEVEVFNVSQKAARNSEIQSFNENKASKYSFPHFGLPVFCESTKLEETFIHDTFNSEELKAVFDLPKVSSVSMDLLADDPFLSCFDGGMLKRCADLTVNSTLETNLDFAGLHVSLGAPEVLGITDPMFSDKASDDDDSDLHLFLNSIVKDEWTNDNISTFSQTSAQGNAKPAFHMMQPLSKEPNFVLPNMNGNSTLFHSNSDFWTKDLVVKKSREDEPSFPFENAHLKYDWAVKYRTDTKIVIFRTQKAIVVR